MASSRTKTERVYVSDCSLVDPAWYQVSAAACRRGKRRSLAARMPSIALCQFRCDRSGQAGEFAEAFHFGARDHGAILLHHCAHLQVLLEDGVDVLDCGAAPLGDAFAPFAIDDIIVAALLVRHRVDDRFDSRELPLVHFGILGKILQWAHLGHHVHDFFERTHLANLLELIAKILEREFFFAELALEVGSGFFVDCLLDAFDERHEVAHAENAGNDALGIETFEGIVFFAEADEFYGCAGNFANAQRSATAGVAVKLSENYASQAEALMEFARGAHRILTDHGIGDEEYLAGLQLFLQHAQLVHQVIVDVQAACGVHQDHVAGGKLRFLDSAFYDFERLVRARARPDRRADGFRNLRELFASGGPVNVRGNNQRTMAMLRKPSGEFSRGGGLA